MTKYPIKVSRGPYSFTAWHEEQERQLKEFLGIEPAGLDMDAWLSERDLSELNHWKTFWNNIFIKLPDIGMIPFIINKYNEYKAKLTPPAQPRIIGKVTHAVFGTPLALAKITFIDSSTLSGDDGNYTLLNPTAASGRIKCELSGFRTIRQTISAPTKGDLTVNFELLPVPPPEPPEPEPTWWEKLLELAATSIFYPWLRDKALFKASYQLLTGEELTEREYAIKVSEIVDYISPLNIMSKLFYGKNLRGEPEEFSLAEDWLDTFLVAVPLIIPGNVDDIAVKVATKTITSKEAAKLTAKLGVKATADKLLKVVKLHPTTSAKLLSRYPPIVRDAVIKGLGKTGFGREVIYSLAKTGFFKYTRTIWKKAIDVLFKASGILIATVLPIFAITEIPNYLVMRQFARKQILQEKGEWPSDIAFKLNDLEDIMRDHAYNIDKDIGAKRAADASEKIKELRIVLGSFRAYIIDKKDVMLPEDLSWSYQLIDFYNLFISDREKRIGEIEIPTEVVPLKPGHGYLILTSYPEGATVTIAGHPEIIEEGTYLLLEGTYTVYFELEGYKPATKYINVKDAETKEVSVTLIKEEEPEPKKAELLITSKPSFADVMIDGKATFQKTPYTAFLDEGLHRIRVELADYEPLEEELEIFWGDEKDKEFILNKTPPTKGTLRILSEPAAAQVYINGKSQFATTPFTITLPAETYKIRLTKDGYLPDEADVIVEAGVEKEHKVELKEKPVTQATITITSEPTEADIYIDGEYQYVKTPYTVLLDPKEYIFRIQKDGYYPIEIMAEVEEGEVSSIPFPLELIPVPEVPAEPYIPYTPYYPTYEPAEPYIPSYVTTPALEIPEYNYDLLYPEILDIPGVEPVSPPTEKELIINIETTDLMPTLGRIYSIAFLDLSDPTAEIQVAVMNDEAELINAFLDYFETGGYEKITGYNVSFDYRYIFTKMMKYRRPSKAWKDAELRDVMQIMKQVKEEFVFGFNKPGTLDAWGKMILGKGKYGSQELMLRKYLQGDFDYVRTFQNRQIELTKDLYAIARFVSSEAIALSPMPMSEAIEQSITAESIENPVQSPEKICPNCKAYNKLSVKVCEICGASI